MTKKFECQVKGPIEIQMPSELKSHPDFSNAKIKIGPQLIHFILPGRTSETVKEIWQLDTFEKTWTAIKLV